VKPTQFVLIRHAQSTWNAAGRWQGHADPPLSECGREQARRCAESLEGQRADLLICSDLLRTRETAEAVGGALGLVPEPSDSLRELDIGHWTGSTREEIQASEAKLLAEFDGGDPDVRPPGGETRREIRTRVRSKIAELAEEHAGKRVVLVVHAGVIRALLPGATPENCQVLEVTLDEIWRAIGCQEESGSITL
jgi:broad specificity phosphatase PhoE